MAKSKRSAILDSRTKRLALEPGREHAEHLAPGQYLLYWRPASGAAGSWSARFYDAETRKKTRGTIGTTDDFSPADGVLVLDHEVAKAKAREWCQAASRKAYLRSTGEVISDTPLTVGECLNRYEAGLKREGRPTETVESYSRTRIRPIFGDTPVAKLTKTKIEEWLDKLAASPRRRTGQRFSTEGDWGDAPATEGQLKSRRSTANRILAILKRSLTLAVEDKRYSGPEPWRDVKPLKNTGASRTRFLSTEEQGRLVNVCPPDFRALVLAALYTGSRFGPLTRLLVRDFDPKARAVWIEKDKGHGDTSRWVSLDDEGAQWFESITAGRKHEELILQRSSVQRVTRTKGNLLQWMPSDQRPFMRAACLAAEIEPMTFHELRHTYASMLANAGVPLAFIAEQLGHANTRMVEKFYGHFCRKAQADAIRKLTPKRGLSPEAKKITPLKTRKRA